MLIIKDKTIIEDSWSYYSGEGNVPDGDVIVPFKIWQKTDLPGRRVGLRLEPGEHPDDIAGNLDNLALIAINFPTFNDGRGYSYARILRGRFGYKGEIRAVGEVMRDQMFYMQRCGFNAYEVKSGRSLKDALKAFNDFTVKYQISSDQ